MEAQSADPNWANQTEEELFRLSYAIPLGGKSNIHGQANNSDSMALPYVDHALNMQPQVPHVGHAINAHSQVPDINIGTSSLSYEELQLGNPDLWDGRTYPISLFGQTATQEIDD